MAEGTAPATKEVTEAMNGSIRYALFDSPTSLIRLLPKDQAAILDDTLVMTLSEPSKRDRELAQAKPGQHLLGLFTDGPNMQATIQTFASDILAVGYDPQDVARHEAGHRLDHDHSKRSAAVALFSSSAQAAPGRLEERVVTGDTAISCPVCALPRKMAEVVMNLEGLRLRSHLQHQIPLGLGGLIPLSRRQVDEARSLCGVVESMLPDRDADTQHLQTLLADLQESLLGRNGTGWMTPEDVSVAHTLAYRAWDRAYDLAHIWFLRDRHGSEAELPAWLRPAA
jgi:hypothetical protein